MTNYFNKMKLRTKIIGIILFSSTLLVLGGLFAFKDFSDKYSHRVFNESADKSQSLAQEIAAQFFERYGDVQAFALNATVKSLDSKKLQSVLNEYVSLYGIYDMIIVTDKNGRFVASNSVDSNSKNIDSQKLSQLDFSKTDWFQKAINEQWTADNSKKLNGTYFESVHFDPLYEVVYGEKRTGTSFTAAIYNEKKEIVGVITNRANNRWFENAVVNLQEKLKAIGVIDGEISIIDKNGFVISELAPKQSDGKNVFEKDYEKIIFKLNYFENHMPAGENMRERKTGSIVSRMKGEGANDLVGYSFIDDPRWVNDIGWTVMVHIGEEEAFAAATEARSMYILISGFFFLISISFATFVAIRISKSVDQITQKLASSSQEVSAASVQIASQATQLSEASTEQAAAIQQTVAAVDQISAMVEKNSDAAHKSKEVSALSRESAVKGRQTVDQMIQAINDINLSNEEISEQMSQSNKQLSEITKLIGDIANKTKVINEIVFQTKLLSFNASVEAARAGEYGKGFAVVAEEVGNLAQMSGNASKEISEMLEQSTQKVNTIVADTKNKVEKLMNTSKEKVSYGVEIARDCNSSLEEILSQVSSVDALISEIAVASSEQSTGIREISKAVGQMEEVTQQNSAQAQASSMSAERLSQQSNELGDIVVELVQVVNGTDKKGIEIKPLVVTEKKKPQVAKNNVVKFEPTKPVAQQQFTRKAAGSDFQVPSADDPNFEE